VDCTDILYVPKVTADVDIQCTETGCTEKTCTESVCTEIVLYRKRPTPMDVGFEEAVWCKIKLSREYLLVGVGCGLMMHPPIGAHSQTAGDGRHFRVTACNLSKVSNCSFSTSVLSVLSLLVVTDRCVV